MEGVEREKGKKEIRAEAITGRRQQKLQMVRLVDGSEYDLPKGWTVELRSRSNPKYFGKIDQFYYEPHTGRQFRSWKSAKNHVEELEQNKQTLVTSEFGANFNKSTEIVESSHARKDSLRLKRKKGPSFLNLEKPPESIIWNLSDAENDKWSAHVETMVPVKVQQHWTQAFASLSSRR